MTNKKEGRKEGRREWRTGDEWENVKPIESWKASKTKGEEKEKERKARHTGVEFNSSTGGATKTLTRSSSSLYWAFPLPKYVPGAPVRRPGSEAWRVPRFEQ